MVLSGTISPTPFTTVFVGVTVKGSPEQMILGFGAISGVGFTVTVTRKGVPGQSPNLGVTWYSTVCTVLVMFRSN